MGRKVSSIIIIGGGKAVFLLKFFNKNQFYHVIHLVLKKEKLYT